MVNKQLHNTLRATFGLVVAAALFSGFVLNQTLMDGTETLGDPTIAISGGTGIAASGVGLQDVASDVINLDVPAGATINQVLVYWAGATRTLTGQAPVPGDDAIVVGGVDVTGSLIGGPAYFFSFGGGDYYYSNYRADITTLGLVNAGANAITVSGLDNKDGNGLGENSGVGILVVYDDGGIQSTVGVKDGLDLAFDGFPEPRKSTVAQSFGFAASGTDRVADFAFFAGSVGPENRTSIIRITPDVGPTQDLVNVLGSHDGDLWDTITIPVDIPAGASSVTVQVISGDGTGVGEPASLNWVGAGLAVPGERAYGGCTYTQGYWRTHNETFRGGAKPDPTWTLIGDWDGDGEEEAEGEMFFSSGLTWYQAIWRPVRGNQYFSLSQQWIAAYLNSVNGADVSEVEEAIEAGQRLFETYSPRDINRRVARRFYRLASLLTKYNEGEIGPGHCDSNEDEDKDGDWKKKKKRRFGKTDLAETPGEIPGVLSVESAYPNPFVDQTTIRFNVESETAVRVVVYDVLGRKVKEVADAPFAQGQHEVVVEGSSLPKGTYFYRLDTEYGSVTGNLVVMK